MVDMVNDKVRRGRDDKAVHSNFPFTEVADGIVNAGLFNNGPFEFFEGYVIFWIDKCKTVFGQRDFTECVPVAQPAVKDQKRCKVLLNEDL